MTRPGWQFLLVHIALLLGALLLGLIVGRPWPALALALGLLLAWQLWRVVRFEHWLRHRTTERPPNASGLWGDIVAITSRIYRRKVFHKRRVLVLLREFRRMTSAMPDGAILLGPNREILWFNRTAGHWLGLRRKVDYGIRIDNLVRHPDFVEYLDSKGASLLPKIQLPKVGERWLTFRLVTTNTTGQQLLIVRDVSAEARLESMRKDFVANASHELRSPLTVIAGYLDSLAEEPGLEEAWKGPVEEMRRQSERMRGIVQDLLELSRLEAAGEEAERMRVDIGGMLALMRKEALARPKHPATIELQLDSDAMLLGSEIELHSIFQNLISNALKFTPDTGRLEIRWWADATGGHVSVADSGIGIPAEHLPRLTERFYRVDPGRSRGMGGSGLGLAIVKHALNRHDGRLEITSAEGKGSVFTCHFPPSRVLARDS